MAIELSEKNNNYTLSDKFHTVVFSTLNYTAAIGHSLNKLSHCNAFFVKDIYLGRFAIEWVHKVAYKNS